MSQPDNTNKAFEQAGEDLFNFAVDRGDVKTLMEHLAPEAKCNRPTVEYELQILKIITTGWSLSFFVENRRHREKAAENFWKKIHAFAADLSETTGLMTGHDIDYFAILQKRLDSYVAAMADEPEMHEPAAVIGPEFARFCGDADDVFTVMTGSRMFILTVARVKEYLETLNLQ